MGSSWERLRKIFWTVDCSCIQFTFATHAWTWFNETICHYKHFDRLIPQSVVGGTCLPSPLGPASLGTGPRDSDYAPDRRQEDPSVSSGVTSEPFLSGARGACLRFSIQGQQNHSGAFSISQCAICARKPCPKICVATESCPLGPGSQASGVLPGLVPGLIRCLVGVLTTSLICHCGLKVVSVCSRDGRRNMFALVSKLSLQKCIC